MQHEGLGVVIGVIVVALVIGVILKILGIDPPGGDGDRWRSSDNDWTPPTTVDPPTFSDPPPSNNSEDM